MLFFDDPVFSAQETPVGADKRPRNVLRYGGDRTSGVSCFVRSMSDHGWTRKSVAWQILQTSVQRVRALSEKHFPVQARARISSKTTRTGWTSLHKQVLKRILIVRPWMDEPRTDLHGRTDIRNKPHRPPRGKKGKNGNPRQAGKLSRPFLPLRDRSSRLRDPEAGRYLHSAGPAISRSGRHQKKPSRFFGPRMSGEATCISGRNRRGPGR